MPRTVEELIIPSNVCNSEDIVEMDLSDFSELRKIQIGSNSFQFVNTLILIGLSELTNVTIGRDSFGGRGGMFVKNCSALEELTIGHLSFNDYSVCEIENVPSLEMIEMGEVDEESFNFRYASLELRSDDDEMK